MSFPEGENASKIVDTEKQTCFDGSQNILQRK